MNRDTNNKFIELLDEAGFDVRPSVKNNKDVVRIARALMSTPPTVVSWLSPPDWKMSRRMPENILELFKLKLERDLI